MSRAVKDNEIPKGYITGMNRHSYNGENVTTHLYKGDFNKLGNPMCKYGWNDPWGGYSIFRNVVSNKGVCKICLRRANQGLKPVE